jgi:hypothetical protein
MIDWGEHGVGERWEYLRPGSWGDCVHVLPPARYLSIGYGPPFVLILILHIFPTLFISFSPAASPLPRKLPARSDSPGVQTRLDSIPL